MARKVPLRNADLRGAARLATDATAGLTDLVEAVHERVARVPYVSPATLDGRTGGLTGLVYKTIRGVTRVVGGSIEALLGLLEPALAPGDPIPEREALLAALNGVMGDYLAATANPLAIPMTWRLGGVPLVIAPEALAKDLRGAGPQVLVMLHGLCMNDLQWRRDDHDHGAALARDLGFTPVYLHYNSGLHVSINGHALAQQLERLVEAWPQPVERIVLLGHSMGGLLARSAMHYGTLAGHRWRYRLGDVVFVGTPHHGAPLERAGNWVDILLGATPYAAPFARLGKLRSAGITDLRHGNLLDEDWVGRDRFARGADRRQHVPLPHDVRCFAIGASVGQRDGDMKDRLLGDGLVPLDSALGQHKVAARCLKFEAERKWVGYGINHLELLRHRDVYDQLKRWLAPDHPA